MATKRRTQSPVKRQAVKSARSRPEPLVIVGGGGHGIVVAEAAGLSGWRVDGFLDDHPDAAMSGAFRRLGAPADGVEKGSFIICIGDVAVRRRVLNSPRLDAAQAATVVHPTAFVSPSASLGRGVFVGPAAVVHSYAVIGDHAIINTGAVVEHHCVVGENSHIAPGAVLAGASVVGKDVLVGVGARVLPRVTVGDRAVVGAGSVVVEGVAEGRTVIGVPAR